MIKNIAIVILSLLLISSILFGGTKNTINEVFDKDVIKTWVEWAVGPTWQTDTCAQSLANWNLLHPDDKIDMNASFRNTGRDILDLFLRKHDFSGE